MLGAVECPGNFSWTREQTEVSRLSLTAPVQEITPEITPWVHWVSCWHGQSLQWTGPVQELSRDRTSMSVDVRDVSTFMWRTRTQITQQWQQMDVAPIAADMWRNMLRLHNIAAEPETLPARIDAPYDFSVAADLRMMHQDMSELAKMGLRWTVVRGRPILGDQPVRIVAELAECDISGGAKIRRSGARTSNDVRVQGKNGSTTERTDLAGLHLQSIMSLDDLKGVANIATAAGQYIRRRATIRDELVIPPTATLSVDAPVELDMLVPGVYLMVSALGLRTVLRLDQVTVTGSSTGMEVAVRLSTPDDLTELEQAGGQVQG
jgi:hypothetical protein